MRSDPIGVRIVENREPVRMAIPGDWSRVRAGAPDEERSVCHNWRGARDAIVLSEW